LGSGWRLKLRVTVGRRMLDVGRKGKNDNS